MDFEQTQQIDFEFSQVIRDEPDDVIELKKVVATLTLQNNNLPPTEYPLYDGINCIGRGKDNQVFIDNKALSKRHAIIQMESNLCGLIFDLGSVNKTRRGRVFLKPQVRYNLENNDVLWFGNVKTTFKFSIVDNDDDATSEDSESLIATSPQKKIQAEINTNPTKPIEKIKPSFNISSDEEIELTVPKKISEGHKDIVKPTANFNLMSDDETASDSEPQEPSKRKIKLNKSVKSTGTHINKSPPLTEAFVEDSQYTDSIDLLADLKLPEYTEKSPVKIPPLKDISDLNEDLDSDKTASFNDKENIFEDTKDCDLGGESSFKDDDLMPPTQPIKKSVRANEEPLAIPGTSKSSATFEAFKKPHSVVPVNAIEPKKEILLSKSKSHTLSVDLDAMIQNNGFDDQSVEQRINGANKDSNCENNVPTIQPTEVNHLDNKEAKIVLKLGKDNFVDLNAATQLLGRRNNDETSSDEEEAPDPKIFEMETQKIESDLGTRSPMKTSSKNGRVLDLDAMTQPIQNKNDDQDVSSDEEEAPNPKIFEMETQKLESDQEVRPDNDKSSKKEIVVDLQAMTQPIRNKNVEDDTTSDEEEDPYPNLLDMETQKIYPVEPKTPVKDTIDLYAETQPILDLRDFEDSDSFNASPDYKRPKTVNTVSLWKSGSSIEEANVELTPKTSSLLISAIPKVSPQKKCLLFNANESDILSAESQSILNKSSSFEKSVNLLEKSLADKSISKNSESIFSKITEEPARKDSEAGPCKTKDIEKDIESNAKVLHQYSTKEASKFLEPPKSSAENANLQKAFLDTVKDQTNDNTSSDADETKPTKLPKKKTFPASLDTPKYKAPEHDYVKSSENETFSSVNTAKENQLAVKLPSEKSPQISLSKEEQQLRLQHLYETIDTVSKVTPDEQITKKKDKITISFDSDEDELPDISWPLSRSNSAENEPGIKATPELKKVKVPGIDILPYTQDAECDFIDIIMNVPKNITTEQAVAQSDETKRNTRQKKVPKRFLDNGDDESNSSPVSSRKNKNRKTDDLKLVKNVEDNLFAKPMNSKVGKSSKSKNKASKLEVGATISKSESSTLEVTKSSRTKVSKSKLKGKSVNQDSTIDVECIASTSSKKDTNEDVTPQKKRKLKQNVQDTSNSSPVYGEDDETAAVVLSDNETHYDSATGKRNKSVKIKIKAMKKNLKNKANNHPNKMEVSGSDQSKENASPSYGDFEKRFEFGSSEEKPTDVSLLKTTSKKDKVIQTRTKNKIMKADEYHNRQSNQLAKEKDADANENKVPVKRGRTSTKKTIVSGSNVDSDVNGAEPKPTPKKSRNKKATIQSKSNECSKTLKVNDSDDATVCNRKGSKSDESSLVSTSSAMPEKTEVRGKSGRKRKSDSKAESEVSSTKDSPTLTTNKESIDTNIDFVTPLKHRKKALKITDSVSSSTSSSNKSSISKTTRSASPEYLSNAKETNSKQKHEEEFNIMFTGFSCLKSEKIITSLGGNITTDINLCTHLITDKFRRTTKLLCAFAKGVPVINDQWIEKAKKEKTLKNFKKYILKDDSAESKYDFKTEETQKKASKNPLLTGWSVYVTPKVVPAPSQMKDIIESAGGKLLPKMPKGKVKKTVIVSCEKDLKLCSAAKKNGIPIVDFEFILTGILAYKINLESHKL